jgi:hypothetical protein
MENINEMGENSFLKTQNGHLNYEVPISRDSYPYLSVCFVSYRSPCGAKRFSGCIKQFT